MQDISWHDLRLVMSVIAVSLAHLPAAARADDAGGRNDPTYSRAYASAEAAEGVLLDTTRLSRKSLFASWQSGQIAQRRRGRFRLDVEPLLADVLRLVRDAGIPLHRYRDPVQTRAIGITASFNLGDDYPAVAFHLADRAPETLTAFYRGGKGLSWAFVWPLGQQLMMRLEGGKRSEFGSIAIAGAQWNHATLPLAIGLGVPLRMRNAEGEIGVIFQVRAKLQ